MITKFYSSPNKDYPQELPEYWKSADQTVYTNLNEMSDGELNSLGWHGPITMPDDIAGTSQFTHSYTWNSDTLSFDVEELDIYEKKRRVNYSQFWTFLTNGIREATDENGQTTGVVVESIAYQKLKSVAKASLEANTILTEFIALLTDAKYSTANTEKIQNIISDIIASVPFTSDELAELQEMFDKSGMFSIYTLS